MNRLLLISGMLLVSVGLGGCCDVFCDKTDVTCGEGTIKSELGGSTECVVQDIVKCGEGTKIVTLKEGEPEGGLTGERECVTSIVCGEGTKEVELEGGLTGERECVPDTGEPEGGLTGER